MTVYFVRCYRSAPLWRDLGDAQAFLGYLPRSRQPDRLQALPEAPCRFTSAADALDAARQWLGYWLDLDDYLAHAQVIDETYELLHEFEAFPVRVPVTTRTKSGVPDSRLSVAHVC